MPLEITCLAYAGLAGLARSSARYRRNRTPFWALDGGAARMAGIVALLLSLMAAIARFGPRIGLLTWLGLSMLSGVALVLLLSRSPRLAFGAVPPLLAATVAIVPWI